MRILFILMLVACIFNIFDLTVFSRKVSENQGYNLHLFWSYKSYEEGDKDLAKQIVLNVLMFVPVGLLFGLSFRSAKWWHALLVGFALSFSIELLQYLLHRGFAEFDDVFHNVLGCLVGFEIYALGKRCVAGMAKGKVKPGLIIHSMVFYRKYLILFSYNHNIPRQSVFYSLIIHFPYSIIQ